VSLRDQLLAKGLASKRDAQRVERELKQQRREAQGARRSKAEVEAEARAAAAAEAEAKAEALRAQRREAEARREAVERELRARNLIDAHRSRRGGGQAWWFRRPDGAVERTEVSSGVAQQLRCGEAALVRHTLASGSDVVVVPREAAVRLLEIAPERVLCFVRDTAGISDPSERFLLRDWEPSLRPRRATPADLERLRTCP
jgi:uncharacterized protein YaiL (DUF2058 family)